MVAASCCGDVFQRQGRLVRIEAKMNGAKYREILDVNLLQSCQYFRLGRRFIFQQDNNHEHTAKTTQEWLRDKSLNLVNWPSQSLNKVLSKGSEYLCKCNIYVLKKI